MMKALLIVSAISGGMGGYEVEMPSMDECLEARVHEYVPADPGPSPSLPPPQ